MGLYCGHPYPAIPVRIFPLRMGVKNFRLTAGFMPRSWVNSSELSLFPDNFF